MRYLSPAIATLLIATASVASAQTTVYSNNFNGSPSLTEWSLSAGLVAPSGGCTSGTYCSQYLGTSGNVPFSGNQGATLTLNGLAAHTTVSVKFDFFAIESLDGNDVSYGPDYFILVANAATLVHTTFTAPSLGFGQCFPTYICNADINNSPTTGATEINTLGYNGYGNAVYSFMLTFADASPTLALSFSGSGLQGWNDEGWGIDNLLVETNAVPGSGVPEPSTIALMLTGLLGVGGTRMARRRGRV